MEIGYYDQEHQNLDPDKTLFDEIADAYPNLNGNEDSKCVSGIFIYG